MKALLALALIAPACACATVTRGSTQAFTVESEPPGASVQTTNGLSCNATPCTFARVERDSEFAVTVSMPGYRSSTHNVTHQTAGSGSAGMAGNVLLGGIIGAVVDANSGATQDLVPNPLRVTLVREEPEPVAAPVAAEPVVAAAPTPEAAQTAGGAPAPTQVAPVPAE